MNNSHPDLAHLGSGRKIDWSTQHAGTVNYATDQVVIFYKKSVEDGFVTRTTGKRIFRTVDYIKMHTPGEHLNVIDRPATEMDMDRYPTQWHKFIHNQTQIPDGIPVDLLFPNTPHIADMLKSRGVWTVEQLANLSANALDNIGMGSQGYMDKAKKYLDNANKGAQFHIIEQQLKEKDNEMQVLKQQLSSAVAQIKALQMRVDNPHMASNQPPYVPGYDVEQDRINMRRLELTKNAPVAPVNNGLSAAEPANTDQNTDIIF